MLVSFKSSAPPHRMCLTSQGLYTSSSLSALQSHPPSTPRLLSPPVTATIIGMHV